MKDLKKKNGVRGKGVEKSVATQYKGNRFLVHQDAKTQTDKTTHHLQGKLESRVAIMCYLKCPMSNKKFRDMQRKKKVRPILLKKSLEIISNCLHMLDLADKSIKAAIRSMLKKNRENRS